MNQNLPGLNQNFIGQPNAEDVKALETLRRGLIPMLATLDKLKYDMEMAVKQKQAIDWPQIQRATSTVNGYITTLMTTINGGRRYTLENRKTDAGKVLKTKSNDGRRDYRDVEIEPQADIIRNLHPFPTSPYTGTDEHVNTVAQGLLRKRMEPAEEKWVEERLQKALEFATLPPEWGIEARKPSSTEDAKKESDDEIDAVAPSTAVNKFNKRVDGILTEEQLVQRWNSAHTWFFNPPRTDFDDEDEYEEGEEGDEEDDEDGFEDAMATPAADAGSQPSQEDVQPAKPPPPVVMIQEAEPPVHKPVPGMPVLDLGVIQKFMATGHL